MSRLFLNTTGRRSLGIALCDRCQRKFPVGELRRDPAAPGLMVCEADMDQIDPWTLPVRAPENISLRFVRKETDISISGGVTPIDGPWPPSTNPSDPANPVGGGVVGDGSGVIDGGGTDPDPEVEGALLDADGNPMVIDEGELG